MQMLPKRSILRHLTQVWLVVLLALAQHGAYVHALTHVGNPAQPQSDKKLTHAKACDGCLSYAKLAGTAPLGSAVPPSLTQIRAHSGLTASTLVARAYVPYRSRAPPVARSITS